MPAERMPTHRIQIDTLDGNLWGWTIDPAPTTGMHLRCQTLDGRLTVDLELPGRGQRAWLPRPGFPGERWRQDIEESRPSIEAAWLADSIHQGRVRIKQDGSSVVVQVYPGEGEISFERVIDLRRDASILRPPTGEGEIALVADPEPAVVVYADRPERWQVLVPLAGKLWRRP